MKITGSGVLYSLETTSLPTVIRQAVECLTFRGICGILGASPVGTHVSLDVIHLMTALRWLFKGPRPVFWAPLLAFAWALLTWLLGHLAGVNAILRRSFCLSGLLRQVQLEVLFWSSLGSRL